MNELEMRDVASRWAYEIHPNYPFPRDVVAECAFKVIRGKGDRSDLRIIIESAIATADDPLSMADTFFPYEEPK